MMDNADEQRRRRIRRTRPPVVESDGKGNISFRGDITLHTAHDFEIALREAEMNPAVQVINLRLTSPGGGVESSLYMYDLMRTCTKGIICTICEYACSGGSLVICGADIVLAYESSLIMIHEIQNYLNGKQSHTEMKSDVESQEAIMKRMVEIYNEKTARKGFKITKEKVGQDWWITSKKAKEIGLIDEIIEPLARPEIQLQTQTSELKRKRASNKKADK